MPINPNAIGAKAEPQLIEWTDRNTLLYALGVGAGTADLSFTTENSHDIAQQVLAPHRVMQTNVVPTGSCTMRTDCLKASGSVTVCDLAANTGGLRSSTAISRP
jgi:hypothetical protein